MIRPLAPPTDEHIRNALEAVYRQFATLAPTAIEGCPCCLSRRGVDVLLTTPLRGLTAQALWSYVSGVFYTLGSERDFRYLLPRILDIAISDPGNSNAPEIVLGKIGLANWTSWSHADREAVQNLVDAWFEILLQQDLAQAGDGGVGWEAESLLCGAARGGLPITHWLACLKEASAAPVLADLKERFPKRLSAFWKDAPEGLVSLAAILGENT